MSYEYKVVPAPARGLKAKGIKTSEDRFAHALETAMNELSSDGWEYLRADTLPCEQREGLMGKTTVFQNMLVFRRTKVAAKATQQPPRPPVAAPRPVAAQEPMVQKKIVATAAPAAPVSQAQPAPEKKQGPSPDFAAE
ncbi:uncharacterized protein DUF4177 [Yoonia maricola]|uniref:Uncharacterized protein DUF4177 n=1 Tax=Yoonia maricola TaxID=420999 RepID=A0A2M8WKE0_9RHOB|nr:DUF4177 domain-containing protein [Yoonia maricola]PJI91356.1 uncharacterized protein DUF4177 [Yoonia maricola]